MLTNTQKEELALAQRFLNDSGFQYTNIESRLPPEPDIFAIIDNRNIGIEVSVFHADRSTNHKSNGSLLRQEAEKAAKEAPDKPHPMSVPVLPYEALEIIINDKIGKAEKYDLTLAEELWLLIPAQQPTLGALAPTFAVSTFIDVNELNRRFHENLLHSRFNCVCWHLNMYHAIYGWDRSRRWHIVRQGNPPDTSGMEALNKIRRGARPHG